MPFQGLSEWEWLALHADVKVIQQEFGLSYKDRLYLGHVMGLHTHVGTWVWVAWVLVQCYIP